jgi:hypothetical protein
MLPMSFSSNGTSSLCSKVKDEVVGSSPTCCVCNLPIKKEEGSLPISLLPFLVLLYHIPVVVPIGSLITLHNKRSNI